MRIRRNIPTFVFGVSIGLLAGVGFFVFKINDVFNRIKSSTAGTVTVIEQPVKNVPVPDEETKRKNRERFKINLSKSAKVNYREVDSLIALDSKLNIATEELLSVKSVKVIKLGDNNAGNDSLVSRLANVEENISDTYYIEFWKTPLNSKGYRFSKNKVMLYGFQDYNNVVLYEMNSSYYVKCADQVYKLMYGADFRPLERVVDTDLLARINS